MQEDPRYKMSGCKDFYDTEMQKLVPRYDKCLSSEVNMLKNSSALVVSLPINLSIKLDFVSVNAPMETYFVDALPTLALLT